MKGRTIKIQILELIESSQGIKQKEIADRLPNTTGATVSAYLGKLKHDKLIHTPRYNSYHLLDDGREVLREFRAKQEGHNQKPDYITQSKPISQTVIDENSKKEQVKKQYRVLIQGQDIGYEEVHGTYLATSRGRHRDKQTLLPNGCVFSVYKNVSFFFGVSSMAS